MSKYRGCDANCHEEGLSHSLRELSKHTNKNTNTQIHKYTNKQIHKYTMNLNPLMKYNNRKESKYNEFISFHFEFCFNSPMIN